MEEKEGQSETVEVKKRVRRTKAQIEADRAAEEAARAAAEAAGEPVKPKRVRRTKAQIEADRAAEEAARAAAEAAGEPVKPKRVRRTKAQIEADRAAEEAARAAAEAAGEPVKPKRVRRTKAQIEADRAAEEAARAAAEAAAAETAAETESAAEAVVETAAAETDNAVEQTEAAPSADAVETDAQSDAAPAETASGETRTDPEQSADTEASASAKTGARKGEGKKPWWECRPILTPEEREERQARVLAEREAAAVRRAKESAERDKFLSFLSMAFPKAIFVDKEERLPLKIGIVNDILDKLKKGGLESQFNYFNKERYKLMHNYCHSLQYLQRLADGVPRVDLDGNFAGEIEEEHRNNARIEIEKIKKDIAARIRDAKKKFKKRQAPGAPARKPFNKGGFKPRPRPAGEEAPQGNQGYAPRGGYNQRGYAPRGGYNNRYAQDGQGQGGYAPRGGYNNRYSQDGQGHGGYAPRGGYNNRYQSEQRPRYNGPTSYPSDQSTYRNSYRPDGFNRNDMADGQSGEDRRAPKVIHRRTFVRKDNNG